MRTGRQTRQPPEPSARAFEDPTSKNAEPEATEQARRPLQLLHRPVRRVATTSERPACGEYRGQPPTSAGDLLWRSRGTSAARRRSSPASSAAKCCCSSLACASSPAGDVPACGDKDGRHLLHTESCFACVAGMTCVSGSGACPVAEPCGLGSRPAYLARRVRSRAVGSVSGWRRSGICGWAGLEEVVDDAAVVSLAPDHGHPAGEAAGPTGALADPADTA